MEERISKSAWAAALHQPAKTLRAAGEDPPEPPRRIRRRCIRPVCPYAWAKSIAHAVTAPGPRMVGDICDGGTQRTPGAEIRRRLVSRGNKRWLNYAAYSLSSECISPVGAGANQRSRFPRRDRWLYPGVTAVDRRTRQQTRHDRPHPPEGKGGNLRLSA